MNDNGVSESPLTPEEIGELRLLQRQLKASGWAGLPIVRGSLPQYSTFSALPTAGPAYAYTTVAIEGTPDVIYVCIRNAGGTWGWQEVDNADLDAHLADTADAHDASAISIVDSGGDFTATDVEGALAELQADAEAHLADTTDAHDASAISIVDAGGHFTATDVEAALQELGAASVPGTIWVPAVVSTTNGVAADATFEGNYSIVTIGTDTQDGIAYFSVSIPTGFTTLTKAALACYSAETGDLRYSVATSWANDGEARTTNSDSIAATTRAVTADQMDAIDVSAALTGIAAGDYVGMAFTRVGSNGADTITGFRVLGLLLEYT